MATHEDDQALARSVLRGEAGAPETLFDRVFDCMYRQVCMRLGGDHHTTQDVVSESLIAGLRALRDFRGDASLVSWFLAISQRKTVDLMRRRAVHLVSGSDGELEGLLGNSGTDPRPLERLADAETRRLVREALESLPSRHRDVLHWKYYDESSVTQVAARLSVTAKAAERRLARARSALASALRRRGIDG